MDGVRLNRLASERSAYLRQHASNPVEWFPWGTEAFERARALDRPILLSVGYSACHWCHVMERESFADEATAATMNAKFVCVKVDREERPDIDDIYMNAVQAFNGGGGGWPMTVFLTPDGRPFWGGTYFPPIAMRGLPAFREVLAHVARIFRDRRAEAEDVATGLAGALAALGQTPASAARATGDWLPKIADALASGFDERFGGFGGPPKFPAPSALAAILAHARLADDTRALRVATRTLDGMAAGGMYDIVGGGFARYSVDAEWRIPHFEKMLYDNAALAQVYCDAWLLTGTPRYARVATDTIDYLLRDMITPEGLFCSSEDADSDGREGKFYVWTPAELAAALGDGDCARALELFDLGDEESFDRDPVVLRLARWEDEPAPDERAFLERVVPRLREARAKRTRPARDPKAVVSWNAMAIATMARGGVVLSEPRYVAAAQRAALAILEHAVVRGRLQRVANAGSAPVPAFLDDHANLVDAFIALYDATFDEQWLREALALADRAVALFWDESDGAFFFAGGDTDPLIARSKRLLGGGEPSGNAVMALAFAKLDALAGRTDLGEKADRILRAVQPFLSKAPGMLGTEALAARWRTAPIVEVGMVGRHGDESLAAMVREVRRRYSPLRVVCVVEPGAPTSLVQWMEGRTAINGNATAFVCRANTCSAPIRKAGDLGAELDRRIERGR